MSNLKYPLPYWWDYTVSGGVLPDFYWNVKSSEERIKKICEDLWKLIQLYKMLVDAINDHEERISTLEAQMEWVLDQIYKLWEAYNKLVDEINKINQQIIKIEKEINTINDTIEELERSIEEITERLNNLELRIEGLEERITTLEERFDHLIESLPEMIKELIKEYMSSDDYYETITDIVNKIIDELLEGKMDLVPGAVEGNLSIFNNAGQVIDSGKSLEDIIAVMDESLKPRPDIPNGMILKSEEGLYESTGLLFNEMYIEAATEEAARALSAQKPLSLVYTVEEV